MMLCCLLVVDLVPTPRSCPNGQVLLHPGHTLQPNAGGYTRILLGAAYDSSNVHTHRSVIFAIALGKYGSYWEFKIAC
jgi:hypothetical protein